MKKQIYLLLTFFVVCCLSATAANRWVINSDGGITWNVDGNLPHEDHIEMSGLKVSTVLRYGVDEKIGTLIGIGFCGAPFCVNVYASKRRVFFECDAKTAPIAGVPLWKVVKAARKAVAIQNTASCTCQVRATL